MQQIDQLYDIYDISYRPFWETGWCKLGLVLLLGAIFVAFIIALWRLYMRRTRVLPLDQYVCARLDEMERYYIVSDQAAPFYASLTDLLKEYLEKKFQLLARSKTDQELLFYIQESHLPENLVHDIRILLEKAYAIKFAGVQLSEIDVHRYVEHMKGIVIKAEQAAREKARN